MLVLRPQWWLQPSLFGQAPSSDILVEASWNVMAHAQKPDFVFRRNGRVHLNRQGRHFSRLLAAEVCASAVVTLDTQCSEVVWRVLATHSIRQFPLHFPSRASPCAITFQLESNTPHLIPDFAQRNPLDISSRHHRLSVGYRDIVNGKANYCRPWQAVRVPGVYNRYREFKF